MVRKDYQKGVYECKDCKVDKESHKISKYLNQDPIMRQVNNHKKRRLLKWVFG